MCCCLSCSMLCTLLQHYKNNLKAVKAHCDEKFQSHCLNLLRWDSIPPNAVWTICFLWMSYLVWMFFLRFAFDLWNQNARESKEKRQKKLIAETHLNQTLLSKVRQTGITGTRKRTNKLTEETKESVVAIRAYTCKYLLGRKDKN